MLGYINWDKWSPDDIGRLQPIWNWVGVASALLAALLWVMWRWQRRAATPEPACGHCGYFVTGLSGAVCPECGSDLRAVGIVAPGDARQAPKWIILAIFALVLPLPVILGWRIIRPALPLVFHQNAVVTLEHPVSGAYRQIRIDARGRRRDHRGADFDRSPIRLTEIDLRLRRHEGYDLHYYIDLRNATPPSATVRVDLGGGRTYVAPYVHRAQDVTAPALLEWLKRDSAMPTDDPKLQAEMRRLADMLHAAMTNGRLSPVAGPSWSSVSSRGGPPAAFMPVWPPAIWLALWIVAWFIAAVVVLRRPAIVRQENSGSERGLSMPDTQV